VQYDTGGRIDRENREMRRLAVVLLSLVAGCAHSRAVNPYPAGTPEYQQWEDDQRLRQTRHSFMFEDHDLPKTTTPPGSVPRDERD
jgi:hypothetical protein